MIDTSGEWWTGDCPDDIDEYLKAFSEDNALDIKPVKCNTCGSNALFVRLDRDEGAIQVVCPACKTKKILLDCEDVWDEAKPKAFRCPICKKRTTYHIKVGFSRRKNGSVKWVYIGSMCTECKTLGSFLDWKIDYEPTDEMEKNI